MSRKWADALKEYMENPLVEKDPIDSMIAEDNVEQLGLALNALADEQACPNSDLVQEAYRFIEQIQHEEAAAVVSERFRENLTNQRNKQAAPPTLVKASRTLQ